MKFKFDLSTCQRSKTVHQGQLWSNLIPNKFEMSKTWPFFDQKCLFKIFLSLFLYKWVILTVSSLTACFRSETFCFLSSFVTVLYRIWSNYNSTKFDSLNLTVKFNRVLPKSNLNSNSEFEFIILKSKIRNSIKLSSNKTQHQLLSHLNLLPNNLRKSYEVWKKCFLFSYKTLLLPPVVLVELEVQTNSRNIFFKSVISVLYSMLQYIVRLNKKYPLIFIFLSHSLSFSLSFSLSVSVSVFLSLSLSLSLSLCISLSPSSLCY